jgi:predicted metal-dependent phosphoesterase TrpH
VGDVGAAPDGAGRATIDLHAHTTASDGTATPEVFVATAVAAGLTAVAVTDHDTVAAVDVVTRLAAPHALRIVPGVELSVHDATGREVHLLGLHLAELGEIEQALASVRDARRARASKIVDKLVAIGVPVTMDEVIRESGDGAIGRPHIARVLMKAAKVGSLQEAFDKWLGAGRPAYVEKERLSIAAGIEMIHRAGGIAVYAHPGGEGTRERLEPLVQLGLDGVEVRHPSHGADEIKRLRGVANALDLVPSGGSDWHGAMSGARTLGCMQVNAAWLDIQLERVTARASR